MRWTAGLALAVLANAAAAEDAMHSDALQAVKDALDVTRPTVLRGLPVVSVSFDAPRAEGGCTLAYEIVLDTGEPPARSRYEVSSGDLDPATIALTPVPGGWGAELTARTRNRERLARYEIEVPSTSVYYEMVRGNGDTSDTCDATGCLDRATMNRFDAPISPEAAPAAAAQAPAALARLLEACASQPANGG